MNESATTTHPMRLAWVALKVVYEDLFPLTLLSLSTWLATATILGGPPGWAALHEMARRVLEARTVHVEDWWQEVRRGFRPAWALAGVHGVVTGVLAVNVVFYWHQHWGPAPYIALLWLWGLIIWTLAGFYFFPLLALHQTPSVWLTVRNSLYLTFLRPLHTVSMAFLLLLITLVSLLLPILLLILPAFWATYTTLVARELILDIRRHAGKR